MSRPSDVSVVIPVYNGARFLAAALDSCLSQTRPPAEILVIDDGSSDDSLEIARSYAVRHGSVVAIHQSQNLGISKTVNRGVFGTSSSYVILLGQDDVLPADHVDKMLSAMDDGTAFAFCNAYKIDERAQVGALLFDDAVLRAKAARPLYHLALTNFVQSCGLMFRREAFCHVGGWDERFRNYGEWLLWIKLAGLGAVHYTAGARALYRRHSTNITNTFSHPIERRALQGYYNYCRNFAIRHGPFTAGDRLVLRTAMGLRHVKYALSRLVVGHA